jgi:tetratricopeptide (TPR) repeat protein
MRLRSIVPFGLLALSAAGGGSPAAGDEIGRRLELITAFAEGKRNDRSGMNGLAQLAPEARAELLRRVRPASASVRALVYYHLAVNGKDKEAIADLDALLKQGAAGGRLRVESEADLERMAYANPDPPQARFRSLAAGMLLALRGAHESTSSLSASLSVLESRESKTCSQNDRRRAAHMVGYFHLRGVSILASQRALENALKDPDWGVRAAAATFVGVTVSPQSAFVLAESIRTEIDQVAVEAKIWALTVGSTYPPEAVWVLYPKLKDIMDDAGSTERAHQAAVRLLRIITKVETPEGQAAWWQARQLDLEARKKTAIEKPSDPPADPPRPPDPGGEPVAVPANPNPASDPVPPPAPKGASPQDEQRKKCAQWLLLAKNHFAMKQYDKAEEALKRVLETCPTGEIAEEARELARRVQAMKGL